jgi:hypothetical protein
MTVAFAQKAAPDLVVDAQLRVKKLDGRATAVAVGAGVHGGHAADAEERIEAPLAAQGRADVVAGRQPGARHAARPADIDARVLRRTG